MSEPILPSPVVAEDTRVIYPDVKTSYEAILAKQSLYQKYSRYYEGDHPLVYSASRLKEAFDKIDSNFMQNWCAVVIDAANDRLELTGFISSDKNEDLLRQAYADYMIDLESDDIHLDAFVNGEAFVIVWKDESLEVEEGKDDNRPSQLFRNDPAFMHAEYDSRNPKKMKYCAKLHIGDDDRWHMTIYYSDRIDYFIGKKKTDETNSYKAFVPDAIPSAINPYNKIPVFHFRISGRGIKSELFNAIPIQDAVNKLFADMMISAEFGAFKQRYVISNSDGLNALKNAPNEIWNIPASDGLGQPTQVGEFTATELSNFLQAIDSLAMSLASVTRTPKHFFIKQQGDPSGEALMTMEAPLVKKCNRYIARFSPVWSQLMSFLLEVNDGTEVDPKLITPIFEKPASVQPLTQADIRQKTVAAGVPLETALRWEGKSESDIEQMSQDKQAEQDAAQQSLADALKKSEKNFNAGGNNA